MPVTPIPLVLDVDTGTDDALALMLACLHRDADLRAVTCVGGNAPVTDVARNTATVLAACGRDDVTLGIGAARPLLERADDARHVHGPDGMAGLSARWEDLPEHWAGGLPSALEVFRRVIDAATEQGTPVTVVPLAPMTNLALLARTDPEVFARIGRIVFMGGGANVSNATASAEFNVFHDPEAAAIVLDAATEHGIPVTMYGLDVFYRPIVMRTDAHRYAQAPAPGPLAGGIVEFLCDRFHGDTATIGDAGAVAAALAPGLVTTQRLPVRVELTGTWTRGRTIVDMRDWAGDMEHDPHGLAPAQVDVAVDIDGPAVAALFTDTLLRRS